MNKLVASGTLFLGSIEVQTNSEDSAFCGMRPELKLKARRGTL
jgi:hypothetical protein